MKTYSEEKGKEKFDWNKTLDALIEGVVEPSKEFKKKLADKSMSWVTCACGNQCSILPRDANGQPLDCELSELGLQFAGEIGTLRWSKAKETLEKIENRSVILIEDKLGEARAILRAAGEI